jgi:imidazolonepropionase-like amidohydrolase
MKRLAVPLVVLLAFAGIFWSGLASTESAPRAGVTAIRNVRVFDGTNVIEKANVVIADGKIEDFGAAIEIPKDASVVDGSGRTLLPGLIDAHTHTMPESLERALRFGVTTELDMFSQVKAAAAARAEQRQGNVPNRADLFSAGTLVTVAGGHGTEYFKIPTYTPGSDPRAFIDERIAEGSDYIKLVYDDGSAFGIKFNSLTPPDLKALIAAAHGRGKETVVHVSTLEGARVAIDAGADGLAHLFGNTTPDAGFGAFVAAHKAFVVPTLTVVESTGGVASGDSLTRDKLIAPYLSAAEVGALRGSFGTHFGNKDALANASKAVAQLRTAGVRILAGTDAGNPGTAHGASMHRELELLCAAGLTPIEALRAATSAPATAFGLKDRGRIAKGLRADLLLVEGDPTRTITDTRYIAAIWKGGVRLDRAPEPKVVQLATLDAAAVSAGKISDFEGGDLSARIGVWQISTDKMMGGTSSATTTVVDGGANGSSKSLKVLAETRQEATYPWAGVMLMFTPQMRPVDLGSKKGISFYARGDGELRLMAFGESGGQMPRMSSVAVTKAWQRFEIPWSEFAFDGRDMKAVLFCGPDKGTSEFQLDEITLH